MKRLFKNIICAVLAPVALVSCMDLDENVYDKLPTDEFGTTEKADQRNHGSGISIFEKYASLRRSLGGGRYDSRYLDGTDTCRW